MLNTYIYINTSFIDVEVIGNKNKPVGYWLAKVEESLCNC